MNANQTIHCGSCEARMRLSPELMRKLEGRTGKLACRACGAELRLDFRGSDVVVETAELPSNRHSAAEWLRQPSSPPPDVAAAPRVEETVTRRSSDVVAAAATVEDEEEIDEIFRTLVPGPPSSLSASTSLASAASMLGSTPAPRSFQLVQDVSAHADVAEMSSQRDSDPFVDSERAESLSPHVLDDDDESALTHLGSSDDSSPYSASLREAEINAIYSSMTPSRQRLSTLGSKKVSMPPPLPDSFTHVDDAVARLEDALDLALPVAPAIAPKKSEAPRPPRPWELSGLSAPSAPGPFERFGMSGAPPVPEVVSLTPDGRLVNASDRPVPAKPRRLPFTSLGLFALAGLALGALGAQPEVQSWIRPEAASAASRTVVIDEPNVVVSEVHVDAELPRSESASAEPSAVAPVAALPDAAPAAAIAPETASVSAPVAASAASSAPRAGVSSRAKKADEKSSEANAGSTEAGVAATDAPGAGAEGDAPKTAASEGSAAPTTSDPAASDTPPSGSSSSAAVPSVDAAPSEPGPFNSAAAQLALQTATAHASSCRREGDPSGTALVVITFAPSGRVTSATISGPPFVGTETGSCIASRFRGASVPAFTGDYVTVSKNVVIQ